MALTSTGLTVPGLADLRAEARADIAASPVLGVAWQTGTGSALGQLLDVILTRIASVYELAVQVYDSFNPDAAEGVHIDNLAAHIGTLREAATYSRGTCELTGVAPNVIPAGTLLRVPDGPTVATDADVTMTGGADPAACTAQEIGEVEILANAVTVIVVPVPGLTSVDNAAAFTTGRERMTDAELRTQRERDIVSPSASTDYGIGAALRALDSVDFARAISDRGVAHTVRCLAYPDTADTDDIATVIWDSVPAGIEMLGAQSAIVTDDEGDAQTVLWDWVTDVTITTIVTVSGIPNTAANLAAIKAAVVAMFALFEVGDDAWDAQVNAVATVAGGPDVETVSSTLNAGASVVINEDELAVAALGDVSVVFV